MTRATSTENNEELIDIRITAAHRYIGDGRIDLANEVCASLLESSCRAVRDAGIYLYAIIPGRSSPAILEQLLLELEEPDFWHPCVGVLAESKFGVGSTEAQHRSLQSVDSGGWFNPSEVRTTGLVTEVPIFSDSAQYSAECLARARPGILRAEEIARWPAFTNWRLPAFLRKYGQDILRWPSLECAVTVEEYVLEVIEHARLRELPYLFNKQGWVTTTLNTSLDYNLPSIFAAGSWCPCASEGQYFYLGRKGTGMHVHSHLAAMNVLVFGVKRWWLFPPSQSWVRSFRTPDGDYSGPLPLRRAAPSPLVDVNPITVWQFPGDLMFVPTGWVHAVSNVTATIGVAWEMLGTGPCCPGENFSGPFIRGKGSL